MQNVFELLKLLDERGAKDEYNLYSSVAGGILNSNKSPECACIALMGTEVPITRIVPIYEQKNSSKTVEVVAIIQAPYDSDYFKCLTVGELKKYLNNIKDKTKPVCVVKPSQVEDGWHSCVLNAYESSDDYDSKNEKMRKITGDNIFHLWI